MNNGLERDIDLLNKKYSQAIEILQNRIYIDFYPVHFSHYTDNDGEIVVRTAVGGYYLGDVLGQNSYINGTPYDVKFWEDGKGTILKVNGMNKSVFEVPIETTDKILNRISQIRNSK